MIGDFAFTIPVSNCANVRTQAKANYKLRFQSSFPACVGDPNIEASPPRSVSLHLRRDFSTIVQTYPHHTRQTWSPIPAKSSTPVEPYCPKLSDDPLFCVLATDFDPIVHTYPPHAKQAWRLRGQGPIPAHARHANHHYCYPDRNQDTHKPARFPSWDQKPTKHEYLTIYTVRCPIWRARCTHRRRRGQDDNDGDGRCRQQPLL